MSARTWFVAISVWLWAIVAAAQVPTGSVSGRIADSDGGGIPGTTVTASSPNLQGARSVVSSEYGDYSLPLLPPGTYTLTFELSGFRTQTRTVSVAPTQNVALNVTLTVGGVSETVNVVAESSPFVNTATVASSFRQELMVTLPTNRTLSAAVIMAPNVHATGPNNTNGSDGGIAIGGAMSFDSLFLLNGVAVTENVRGQPFTLFIEDAIQETTISTGGMLADDGAAGGGLVNAITKSGGNLFSGSYRHSLNNDNWRALTPFTGDTKLDKVVPTYEYTLGGPLAKDRLWFFTAGRIQKQEQARQTIATVIPYTFVNDEKRYEGKLTYSPVSAHTVRGSFTKIVNALQNQSFGNPLDLRSLYTQKQPQDLLSLNYNGIVRGRMAVEAQYSQRNFAIVDAGSPYLDLEGGTLLIDRARGGTGFRYWAPTFCSCNDDQRNNTQFLMKGTYFTSTDRYGAHTLVFGYDTYNDHRLANNHQSGSDYRILGTSTIVRGTDVFPVFQGDGSTLIQWDPIAQESQATDLRVHSGFFNDTVRLGSRLTMNLGLRYDRNAAVDAAGAKVSDSSRFSPRIGVTWAPAADDTWTVSGSFARYVSSLATAVAENSPAGNAATYQFAYQGPAINADPNGALLTSPQAIRQVFDWFNANGGSNRPFLSASIPGVNVFINDSLKSPYSYEYSTGVARTIGGRGTFRFDYVFRDYNDFYAQRTDLTTGRATSPVGVTFDIGLIENNPDLKRRYQGGTFQMTYRLGSQTTLGGNYTLSRLWGNIDGENAASGPLTSRLTDFPEYREARWNLPEGNLAGDQRHRLRLYGTYRVPMAPTAGSLDLSLMYSTASGVPYGLNGATASAPGLTVGQIDPREYVTNPGYANPLSSTATVEYFFFARDRFRTETQHRTDLSINYRHGLVGRSEAFFRGEVLNIFNQFQLCACGGTVFTNGGGSDMRSINTGVQTRASAGATSGLVAFNPFTVDPIEGTHWRLAPNFGAPATRFAYTSPRLFRFSVGVRF